MNEIIKTIYQRRSVRKYKQQDVPNEDILEILKAGHMAPSASNSQPWKFIVIKDNEIKQKIQDAVTAKLDDLDSRINSATAKKTLVGYRNYMEFLTETPVLIAVVSLPYKSVFTSLVQKYKSEKTKDDLHVSTGGVQSVSAAIQNILLASASMGYGTCWMTGPMIAEKELSKILNVCKEDKLLALIPIGIPEEDFAKKKYHRSDINDKIVWM